MDTAAPGDTAAPRDTAAPDDTAALRSEAQARLVALAGPEAVLREDQWRAIEALVVDWRRALVVQRTGWGKSAVYFIATALLRARGAGATVIVSPLLALMRNQVEAAQRAGIRAATINSSNLEEWQEVEAAVAAGAVDVLLVSPERLNNPNFREVVLPRLAAETGLLVIDEAHCISDWGHDFRPDYRRLRSLLADLPAGIPVLATTATANARVVADVAEQLATPGSSAPPLVLRGPLDRASLRLGVLPLPSGAHRLGWLAEHLSDLPGSGIVYTLTVTQAEEVTDLLRARGYDVASYTGRTEPADRLAAEQDLLANRVKALVATSALGMGFDKPDLGFVLHLGSPASPIAYYQQIGRAGRGVDDAEVLLLPGVEDEAVWDWFASVGFPAEGLVRQTLAVLGAATGATSTAQLEVSVDLGRSRLEAMLKVLDVDGAVRRVAGGWVATGEPWAYDAERYERVAAVRAAEAQAMRDYIATADCRLEFLRRQLDDPAAGPCGRCDNCTGHRPAADVADTTVERTRAALLRPGTTLEPRRLWPTGLAAVGVPLKGRIPADEAVEEGRALARLSDLGRGPRLRALLAEGTDDGPVSADLLDAAIAVLRAWEWAERPVAVVAMPSSRRPELIGSLAEGLARVGHLTWLGAVQDGRPGASRTNSAQRVRALHDAFVVPATLHDRLAGSPGPVLLVDDLFDSGWSVALAGRALRRAGASAVLPFALALAG